MVASRRVFPCAATKSGKSSRTTPTKRRRATMNHCTCRAGLVRPAGRTRSALHQFLLRGTGQDNGKREEQQCAGQLAQEIVAAEPGEHRGERFRPVWPD